MSSKNDALLGDVALATNPEPRQGVVLVLDTSGTMSGDPIDELNKGLTAFAADVKKDPLASLRAEICIVRCGGAAAVLDPRSGGDAKEIPADATTAFVGAADFNPPTLVAGSTTPMGESLLTALNLLRARKAMYKANGLDYFRPWMIVITDGLPTDPDVYNTAAQECKNEEGRKGVTIFAIGVEGANMDTLGQITTRQPLKLKGIAFSELFTWLSKSVSAVAQSRPGEQVALPAATMLTIDTSA